MNAQAATTPTAARQTPATLSEPPRELKLAIGYGVHLVISYCPPLLSTTAPYLKFSLAHGQLRLEPFGLGLICGASIDIDDLNRYAFFENDRSALFLHCSHFYLGARAHADAIDAWLAAHGLRIETLED